MPSTKSPYLLGIEDPNEVKQHRAFTMQSQQMKWDIGSPNHALKTKTTFISVFRKNLLNGLYYPYFLYNSGGLKLRWLIDFKTFDYNLLIPDLIEGLTDESDLYYDLANITLISLIENGDLKQLVMALPMFAQVIQKIMKMSKIIFTNYYYK